MIQSTGIHLVVEMISAPKSEQSFQFSLSEDQDD